MSTLGRDLKAVPGIDPVKAWFLGALAGRGVVVQLDLEAAGAAAQALRDVLQRNLEADRGPRRGRELEAVDRAECAIREALGRWP